MSTSPVITRFAPSPTGHLHIGGARTALFCWAFARRTGGRFMLRIEDTDAARSSDESARGIMEDLAWLGIEWDDGPRFTTADGRVIAANARPIDGGYFQARRVPIYNRELERLVRTGRAYPAFEGAEELEAKRKAAVAAKVTYRYERPADVKPGEFNAARWERACKGEPHVVRFVAPFEEIVVHDRVLGDVTNAPGELDDIVIRKADGFPTYHFAVVVDDEAMGVTHVLRAQEHLANTPRHVAMQKALGYRTPVYGHMPLIFNMDGTKMGKRDRDKAAKKFYRERLGDSPPNPDAMAYLMEQWVNKSNLAEPTKHARMSIVGQAISYFAYESRNDLRKFKPAEIVAQVWPSLAQGSKPVYESHLRKFQKLLEGTSSGKFAQWLRDASLQLDPEHVDCLADALDVILPEVEVSHFRANGYSPEAICNFLALLGWNPGIKTSDGKDLEKFNMKFLAENFSIERIGKTNAKFDRVKLASFNGDYLASLSDAEYAARLTAWLNEFEPEAGAKIAALGARLPILVAVTKPRAKTLRDTLRAAGFVLRADDSTDFDAAAVEKNLKANDGQGLALLREFRERLAACEPFDPAALHALMDAFVKEKALANPGPIAQAVRVAVAGVPVTPGIGETLAILGKESTLARIDRCMSVV
ncbi:glutamyl-tRNA synthetase [Phycisphaerales bacterium]|nr:glutamyl-tRNA synthetase [Phycisphaerales bacterium]